MSRDVRVKKLEASLPPTPTSTERIAYWWSVFVGMAVDFIAAGYIEMEPEYSSGKIYRYCVRITQKAQEHPDSAYAHRVALAIQECLHPYNNPPVWELRVGEPTNTDELIDWLRGLVEPPEWEESYYSWLRCLARVSRVA